jgi:type VI secretion system protein ImpK
MSETATTADGEPVNRNTSPVPNPGSTSAPAAEAEADSHVVLQMLDIHTGNSPLIAAANPLLNLIYQIRRMVLQVDPSGLKAHLADQVRDFELRARANGVSQEHVIATRYCLCTVLDETAAQTPWGSFGAWSKDSLLVVFHSETWGGEKFFQLLAKLAQSPTQHIDVLELMYYCICLGFEGRYRVIANGQSQLETLRRRLADIIKTVRGVPDAALSPHWQGCADALPRIWNAIPVWVSALLAFGIGLGVYMLLAFYLAAHSDKTFLAISGLNLPEIHTSPPVLKTPPPVQFSKFLAPEIKQGLVAVKDTPEQSIVIIRGDGLFESGNATIRPRYHDIIRRIADAITASGAKGRILVTGHTDDVPIRSIRFPSNWELSQERARTVANMIEKILPDGRHISIEGRGAAAPVASNTTPEGRAQNRRVEITVFVSSTDLNKEVE